MGDPAAFLREFARARAEVVTERPYGFVVRSMQRFPHAHDHNALVVTAPVDPAVLLADVEAEFAEVGYRRIETDETGEVDATLARALTDAGYAREDQIVMTWVRPPDPDRPAPDGVVELTTAERVAVADRIWQSDFDERDAAVRRELAQRAHSAVAAADCTFLGVVGPDGIEASTDLFVRGDTAQIEEVSTLTPFRGRGHASRLVAAAARQARAAGAATVFLVAEADDWPRHLYRRLGFEVTGQRVVWSRSVTGR